tara:strand:- start:1051 stop:1293 length:243 start_codon:yes stop_codon:yes gene_type:complete
MKNKKINPVEAIAQMQKAKRGKAVGSMLEGGSIVFGDNKEKRKKKKENRKFLRKQREKRVKRRDLDKAGKALYDKNKNND